MINIQEKWKINGVEQFISIRGGKKELPLLFYLHGGPADTALPLVHKYNRALEDYYNVVVWEQRGAGKSYYKFDLSSHICIDTFVQDALKIIIQLLERFHQNKIILVGHSWGSVIGLLLCKQYPQFIHEYIGCGQVVNMRKSCKIAYDFALSHAKKSEKNKVLKIDYTYTGEDWINDLLFVTKQVVKHKGSLYGARNYNRFIMDFIFSKEYNIKELINRQKGSLQGIQYLWQELMNISFEDITTFEMPITFIEGAFDYHVSSALAKEYYNSISSRKQFFVFDKSCHFPQWSESEKFNQIIINELITKH